MQMHDAARALQYLRHHADAYKLDKSRFACLGGSAGGCMALWLAFHDDLADPKNADPVLRESTRILCAAPTGGQPCLDLDLLAEWFGVARLPEHTFVRGFFGVESVEQLKLPAANARMQDASPLTHLSAEDPPVFATYLSPDVPVTETTDPNVWAHHPKQGIKLKEQMDALGIECHVQYPGGATVDGYASGVEFIIQKLKPRPAPGGLF
jgi:acetyl esterase/lipase